MLIWLTTHIVDMCQRQRSQRGIVSHRESEGRSQSKSPRADFPRASTALAGKGRIRLGVGVGVEVEVEVGIEMERLLCVTALFQLQSLSGCTENRE